MGFYCFHSQNFGRLAWAMNFGNVFSLMWSRWDMQKWPIQYKGPRHRSIPILAICRLNLFKQHRANFFFSGLQVEKGENHENLLNKGKLIENFLQMGKLIIKFFYRRPIFFFLQRWKFLHRGKGHKKKYK